MDLYDDPWISSTSTLYVVGQAIFQAPFTALYHGSQGAGFKLKAFKSNKSMKSNKSVKKRDKSDRKSAIKV